MPVGYTSEEGLAVAVTWVDQWTRGGIEEERRGCWFERLFIDIWMINRYIETLTLVPEQRSRHLTV